MVRLNGSLAHRYWRIKVHQNAPSAARDVTGLCKLRLDYTQEIYDTPSGTLDTDTSTYWRTDATQRARDQYAVYDLGTAVKVGRVDVENLASCAPSLADFGVRNLTLERASAADGPWSIVSNFTNVGRSSFSLSIPLASWLPRYQYWRLSSFTVQGNATTLAAPEYGSVGFCQIAFQDFDTEHSPRPRIRCCKSC